MSARLVRRPIALSRRQGVTAGSGRGLRGLPLRPGLPGPPIATLPGIAGHARAESAYAATALARLMALTFRREHRPGIPGLRKNLPDRPGREVLACASWPGRATGCAPGS